MYLITGMTPFKAFIPTASATDSTLDGGFFVIPGTVVEDMEQVSHDAHEK